MISACPFASPSQFTVALHVSKKFSVYMYYAKAESITIDRDRGHKWSLWL